MLLGACVSAGPIRVPETALPVAYEVGGAPLPTQALDRWWLTYGDSQLTQLIEIALARSSDARDAAARLREARAIRGGALVQFDPQGDLQGNAQAQATETLAGSNSAASEEPGGGAGAGGASQDGVSYSASLGFDVSWELDLFGRRGVARRQADANLLAERFDYEGSRASLAANVADALFELRGLAVQAVDAAETQRIQQQLRRVARIRADRGLGAEADVERINAELAQADADVVRLQAEQQALRRALLVLVGHAAAPTASLVNRPDIGLIPHVPASLPGELLARRPDVREAQARLAAATQELRLDELAFFPKFTLNPGANLSTSKGNGMESTTGLLTLAAGLTVPILDRKRLTSELRAEEARTEQAVIAYERAVQTAFSEAEQALVRLVADRRRIVQLAAGEASARRAFEAAQLLNSRGLIDLETLLERERTYRNVRTALTTARVQALRRSVQAFKALGGGWPLTDVVDINRGPA